ncbi:MAG: universal stress protein [bacterium]|jgi:nucleotide-binding universal stress UspA family protein|nr:universal stress protein [candidate division KSB1 bacterium]MDH7560176.1 universal stress protein [bacterium]
MVKRILLPVDGSEYTNSVVKHGIDLARRFGARVRLLSVVDVRVFEWVLSVGADGFVPVLPAPGYQEESRKLLEKKAQAVLDKCARALESEGIPHEAETLGGSPVEIICERANLVDLIIMGNRGEYARWATTMLGATLEAVTRHVSKPIMIVQQRFRNVQRMLAAYDGSEHANRALQLAGFFAEYLGAKITVVHVSDDRELSTRICAEGVHYLQAYRAEVDSAWLSGRPDAAVIDLAAKGKYDLIVMGAYGHSRIREAILGSTTVQIMRKSPVPVLMVK